MCAHLQLTAVDGRRAFVTLPNDPELVDILAKNGVDISVSEGDQQGNYVSLLGNLLFPLIAFGGLFFLFRLGHVAEVVCLTKPIAVAACLCPFRELSKNCHDQELKLCNASAVEYRC